VVKKIQSRDTKGETKYLMEVGEGDAMYEEVVTYNELSELVARGQQVRTYRV